MAGGYDHLTIGSTTHNHGEYRVLPFWDLGIGVEGTERPPSKPIPSMQDIQPYRSLPLSVQLIRKQGVNRSVIGLPPPPSQTNTPLGLAPPQTYLTTSYEMVVHDAPRMTRADTQVKLKVEIRRSEASGISKGPSEANTSTCARSSSNALSLVPFKTIKLGNKGGAGGGASGEQFNSAP